MEVVDIDGKFHLAKSVSIEQSSEVLEETNTVWQHPVSAKMEIMRPISASSNVSYVHIVIDDELYTLTDGYLAGVDRVVGESFASLSLIANELSVRPLHHKV